MDRNHAADISTKRETVALRKESVDRNLWWGVRKAVGSLVALRKESVDRNYIIKITESGGLRSLSARRAWIEIRRALGFVDPDASLSARRAWIEIRNGGILRSCACCRSPQGERG